MLTPLTTDDPQRIGPYRLANRIGAGGMGIVYLGFSDDGKPAAIKVPSAGLVDDPEFRARFRQEVDAARRVRGNAVAAVIDADLTGTRPWMATEYVEGRNLTDAVATRGPFDERLLTGLAVGLADALVAIHAAGVVHRDLKPSNILLAWDGPRVIDFGIARAENNTSHTRAGSLIGTLTWMAPEQLRGERAGPAADVFAWGACVAFAAAGQPAFRGDRAEAVGLQILTGEPVLERLPPTIEPHVRAALRKEPAARPSAAEILGGLLGRPVSGPADSDAATGLLMSRWWNLPPTPPEGATPLRGHPPAGSHPRDADPHGAGPRGGPPPGGSYRGARPHDGYPGGAQLQPGHRPNPGPPDAGYRGPDSGPRGWADSGPHGGWADSGQSGGGWPGFGGPGAGPPGAGRPDGGGRPDHGRRGMPVAVLAALAVLLVVGGVTAGALLLSGSDGDGGQAGPSTGPDVTSTLSGPTTAPNGGPTTSAGPTGPVTNPTSPGSGATTAPPTTPGSGPTSTSTPRRVMTADEAAGVVREHGYTPEMGSYDPDRMLNLVRGTRQGDDGRQRQTAFVFADGEYQGTDTKAPSNAITVEVRTNTDATVTYQTYVANGTTPTGTTSVRFRWNGTDFVALDPIPSDDPTVDNHR
ncbi:serine/threonine protein kinase [Parafrankia sp. EAN1pec]|uniref:protein kinase domain-containing protein n=1 Tax=Parafrankia sp. (strain EAN1pec) TaxID=298653 RepID=UPI00015D9EBD|nr:serine/threonine protein kinase [Frankia sp. EAN1pec]